MTNDILCTIDFSDSSKVAMKWSICLAKRLNSHLSILHTYRLFKQDGEVVGTKRKIEEEASKNFGVLEKELLAGTGITYDFRTEVGFVEDRIENHTKKNKIDFLVMGKGMSLRNKEAFDELLEHLQVPLVIVP